MTFFDKGSLWKHKNLGLLVHIIDQPKPDAYTLGWAEAPKDDEGRMSAYLIRGYWSAVELVRDFTPVVAATKWDRLLDGETPVADDEESSP